MSLVIVILLNVLIAQLSFTYAEAKNNAKLQYAIDRMLIISRLEHSIFGVVSVPIEINPVFHLQILSREANFFAHAHACS
jgi:hypothetical protein